ncbi:alcohol dehydrogenase catalytic domain-containing protein [Bacillus sp. FJAT-29790]|uniref:zinc-dependent alcohol dehydrogenase n=1 Tax=Bacillus sp. FJAT-29790 TaxID=1895002 RepID=UPI001C2339FB|nr:alcohol dehydrogenase catalytic domain-containing protein [Bacillus sp. FJAT-29790]MBU8878706.1 alcohol dehydrogenase catalytic domain-containing protein [Bacillus sp. FJAT-29790]
MLGLYLKKPGELELREISSAMPLKEDEVKIKLIYGGICGSDLSVYRGDLPHAIYPVQPGHELIGTIVAAGEKVQYEVGLRVVIMPNSFCGECEFCQKGKTNICSNKESLGVNANGGFAEEFIISSKYVIPVPDVLANEKAILIEPLSVIVHALEKVNITSETSIAVIGCGTEGLLAIALANYLGAQITGIDINQEKLDKVKENYRNIQVANSEEVNEGMYDVVIEAAGVRASFEQGVKLVKPGGTMLLIGLAREASIPVSQVVRKEISIYGSIIYNMPGDFLKSIDYLSKQDFNVEPIISKIFHYRDYAQAYEDACSGRYGKIVLNFKGA